MNIEQRAAVHAALAEPIRLRIVDALALGDAGPGELAARFGLATNLLAFHLRVLDDAGIVRRVRSEGDRRRHYVQLCLDDPDISHLTRPHGRVSGESAGLDLPDGAPERVLFVCSANSARSQLAAAAWRRASGITSTSAGTRPADRVHPLAVATAAEHRIELGGIVPRGLEDVPGQAGRTLLVAVCDNAHEELVRLHDGDHAPDAPDAGVVRDVLARPWLHWHVPDPVRVGTREAFETAYRQITERVERLAATLDRAS